MERLHELARNKFGDSLNETEKFLIESVESGTIAWCGSGNSIENFWDAENDPGDPAWTQRPRSIRATLVEWLCRDREASKCVHPNGLQLGAAQIDSRIDLSDTSIPFKLRLSRCSVLKGIDVYFSRTDTLNFLGSHVGAVSARRLTVNGDLLLGGGAVVNGEINLRDAEIVRDFDCSGGCFNSPAVAIKATGLRIGRHVRLGSSHRRDSTIDRFKCVGQVDLKGSQIGGDLDCGGASLSYQTGSALLLSGSRIGGSAELAEGFRSTGTVDLTGAEIGGRLNCSCGTFVGSTHPAIVAQEVKVARSLLMNEGFTAEGEVNLGGAEIGGQVNCEAAWFSNPRKTALSLNGARIADSVVIGRNFVALGKVDMVGADIDGQLDCGGAYLANSAGISLDLNGARIRQDVFISQSDVSDTIGFQWGSRFIADGEIDLTGADISGELNCQGGQIFGAWGRALTVVAARISQRVSLHENFSASGEVNFTQTEIGDIVCAKCVLAHPGGRSFTGARMSVSGNVSFNDAEIEGVVNLRRAKILGDATFESLRFHPPGSPALEHDETEADPDFPVGKNGLYGNAMSVSGRLLWRDIAIGADTVLHLQNAKLGLLSDSETDWPQAGNLRVDGCVYDRFEERQRNEPARSRLEWLRRQTLYKPQTYKQLADVFRESGREGAAVTVLVERDDVYRAELRRSLVERLRGGASPGKSGTAAPTTQSRMQAVRSRLEGIGRWMWDASRWAVLLPLKVTVGNGYRPLQAFWPGFALVIVGTFVFSYGNFHRVIVPSDKEAYKYYFSCQTKQPPPRSYEEFDPLVYSLENFLPLIELGQRKSWSPRPSGIAQETNCLLPPAPPQNGWLLSHMRGYLWVHTILGWFVAGMFVAGVTGLVRKD
jgi:hypothetical protein